MVRKAGEVFCHLMPTRDNSIGLVLIHKIIYGMTVSELVATVTTQRAFCTQDNMGGGMM